MFRCNWIHWLSRKPCELWFGLVSLSLSLAMAMPPLRSLTSYANWTPGYYYLNYWQFGFVKRGLLGSLVSLTGLNRLVDPPVFTCFVHILGLITLSVLFWTLAFRCTLKLGFLDQRRKPWLYIVFATSPALFLHFGFDLGRVDLFGFNITLLVLLILFERVPFPLRVASMLLATATGLLSHESYLFFWLPLLGLGAFHSFETEPRVRRAWAMGGWVFLISLIMIILRIFGPFEQGSAELTARFSAIHPSLKDAMQLELTSELKYNMQITWTTLKSYNWLGNSIAVGAYAAIVVLGYCEIVKAGNAPVFIMALVVVGPLLMNLIGVDFIRHLSCSLSAAAVATLISIHRSNSLPAIFRFALVLVPSLFIFAGPLGISPLDPLPLIRYISF